MINSNRGLVQAAKDAIEESGYKKKYIADKLNMKNQNLKQFIEKDGFSIDDANKILSIIGYQVTAEISKKD